MSSRRALHVSCSPFIASGSPSLAVAAVMDDMNALLGGLHAERCQRQGLPVPPAEAPAPVEPPAPVVEAPAQDVAPDEPPPAPADADDGSVRDPDAVVVEQLVDDAELAVPPLMRPDQAERRYDEAVAVSGTG